MQPLYQIKNEYLQALNELENMEGLTPEMIQDSLAAIDAQFEEKALAVAAYIKNLEADIERMTEYRMAMAQRQDRIDNKVEHLKNYLKFNMQALDKKKIEGTEFDISLRSTQGQIIVDDEKVIDNKYWLEKLVKNVDKKAIRTDIDAGEEVKGAHLEQGVSLMIK